MATTLNTNAYTYSTYSPSMASYFQDAPFHPMTVAKHPYPLSKLYVKYIRRVWKRVSRATRKPERASMLPDGFVLINNARLGAVARRKSVLLA